MIEKKILKAKHFLESKLLETAYTKEIKNINHPVLSAVLDTILQIKNEEFSLEDLAAFESLQSYRNFLKNNTEFIDYSLFNAPKRQISEIYQSASSPEIWSRFHYMLAKKLNAKNYLEIGTNLGVSGSYILSALSKQANFRFVTMEGIDGLSDMAEEQFTSITDPQNFKIFRGLYDQSFPELMKMDLNFDVLFIDGNHHYDPTLSYFQQLKSKIGDVAVFVFDDIYWNPEMIKVWKKIKEDPITTFALDLFKMGILIVDKKENRKKTDFKFYLTAI